MRDPSPPSSLRAAALLVAFGMLAWGCEAPPPGSGDAEATGAQTADAAEGSDSAQAAEEAAQEEAQDSAQEEVPDPEAAIIRLDPNDPNLEVWRDRDISSDPPREPGPIRVGSVLTFFGLPVARTIEDLVAGEVEVAFMGAPVDMGVGFRGAGEGPTAFRAMRRSVGSMETMVRWRSELTAVDYGNAPIDNLSTERSMPPIRRMVREIAETGAIPVIIGGDHSIEFANVAGLADVYGKENVGVIHFDAHYDAGGTRSGHLISHAQPVRRLVDEGHILGRNFIQVGLRGSWPGPEGFEWMRENEFRYHTMAEIDRDGWTTVMQRVLDEANDGPEYLHISFDIDVMDPAYTSGTGTPVPGGLTPREVFPIVRGLCSENNVVGFDLVELNPLVDPGYTTALNAKQVVDECMTGIALRKLGLGSRDYLSPLTRRDTRR
ncbi:MAG: agmatinase family protein [Gemmatimonadota bacterium]|nr:agmatinase family protein [Gemmatimonadota bacterium]